jgi:hypothetical protein
VEVTVGPAFTVKQPVQVAVPWSGLVTVTFLVPVAAVLSIETLAVIDPPLLATEIELTVMPPPNETFAPLAKFAPVTVMFWFVAPWPREVGLTEEIVGPAFTVKQPVQVPVPWSGLVTVTSLAVVFAFAVTVTLTVIRVEDTVGVPKLTPVPETDTLAPVAKLLPLIVTVWLVAPWPSELGLTEEIVGPAFTVKQPVQVPVP